MHVHLYFESIPCHFVLLLCIRVKRKGGTSSEIVEVGDGANLIEEEEIVEKQPVLTDVPHLASEEFEKETGDYQSEPDEGEDNQLEAALHAEYLSGGNAASKKRKASKKLQSTKYVYIFYNPSLVLILVMCNISAVTVDCICMTNTALTDCLFLLSCIHYMKHKDTIFCGFFSLYIFLLNKNINLRYRYQYQTK